MLLKSGSRITQKLIKEDTVIKYYYTDKKYKELLSNMVILHAGNEQCNQHILDYFDKNNIPHEKRALKTGDYSFKIKACTELGFPIDTYFVDDLIIERKNSVKELAGNFANNQKDDRFMKELNRFQNVDNVYLIIENDRLDDIMDHTYDTDYNELSFLRTLLTWQKRSNFYLNFVNKENMGKFIYEICKNCLDNYILK
jgi:ERCC4-type nuclease